MFSAPEQTDSTRTGRRVDQNSAPTLGEANLRPGSHEFPIFFAELFADQIPNAELIRLDLGHGSFEPGHRRVRTNSDLIRAALRRYLLAS